MDALWRPIAEAVMGRCFGDLLDDLNGVRRLGGLSGESYVDKDLRTLLGERVDEPFSLRYCGGGSLAGAALAIPMERGRRGRGRARSAGGGRSGRLAGAATTRFGAG